MLLFRNELVKIFLLEFSSQLNVYSIEIQEKKQINFVFIRTNWRITAFSTGYEFLSVPHKVYFKYWLALHNTLLQETSHQIFSGIFSEILNDSYALTGRLQYTVSAHN